MIGEERRWGWGVPVRREHQARPSATNTRAMEGPHEPRRARHEHRRAERDDERERDWHEGVCNNA